MYVSPCHLVHRWRGHPRWADWLQVGVEGIVDLAPASKPPLTDRQPRSSHCLVRQASVPLFLTSNFLAASLIVDFSSSLGIPMCVSRICTERILWSREAIFVRSSALLRKGFRRHPPHVAHGLVRAHHTDLTSGFDRSAGHDRAPTGEPMPTQSKLNSSTGERKTARGPL